MMNRKSQCNHARRTLKYPSRMSRGFTLQHAHGSPSKQSHVADWLVIVPTYPSGNSQYPLPIARVRTTRWPTQSRARFIPLNLSAIDTHPHMPATIGAPLVTTRDRLASIATMVRPSGNWSPLWYGVTRMFPASPEAINTRSLDAMDAIQ